MERTARELVESPLESPRVGPVSVVPVSPSRAPEPVVACPVDHGSAHDPHFLDPSPPDVAAEAAALLGRLAAERDRCPRARIAEVAAEIGRTGTWSMSRDELKRASRIAWRNNARCIGRLFWRGLRVVDHRDAGTAEAVFAGCVEHLDTAYNGGRILPMASVFAPGIRIWNHQLARYAGYRRPNGSVQGDPAGVALTERAQALGWEGAGGRFDLLPLIIEMPGERPRVFDIPAGVVREVEIVHPRLAWFAELGLRWYAVPVISDMCLDAGGIRYTAAPFSGWYMSTEIAARNFADEDRYAMLPEVARRMGLDTSHPRTMWQERALLELSEAVIHSYQAAGVTLVDHHTASAEFARFVEQEAKAGRDVAADRSWIVPPMSPARCPTWSMELTDATPKPGYFYQPAPWDRPEGAIAALA